MDKTKITHDLKHFSDFLFLPGEIVELRIINRSTGKCCSDFIHAAKLSECADELTKLNVQGYEIYFGANPRRRDGGRAEDVLHANCYFIDIDHVPDAWEHANSILASDFPRPTVIVNSGHGLHLYWRLHIPVNDMMLWKRAQLELIQRFDSDPKICDAPRIMRLPGFINHKEPKSSCELYYYDNNRYDTTLNGFLSLTTLTTREPATYSPKTDTNDICSIEKSLAQALSQAKKGTRNDVCFKLACNLRDMGTDISKAEGVVLEFASQQESDFTRQEAVACLNSAYSRPPSHVDGGTSDDPELLPLEDEQVLPEILPDFLPNWVAQYATALSNAKEVSPTFASLLALSILASCVQRKYSIRVEGSYTEPLCIYTAPSLESGERKTAVHGPLVGPIFAVQTEIRKAASVTLDEAKIIQSLNEKQIHVLEKDMLIVQQTGDTDELKRIRSEILKLNQEMPKSRGLPQLIMDDFTEAALGVALNDSNQSLLITSDEGGLFQNLGLRFSELPEIDLFLKAHTGSPHTVNRTGRDNLILDRPLLSVAISPQPGVLAKLGGIPGFAERGLLARFLWALPKSRVGSRILAPAQIDANITTQYRCNLESLAKKGFEYSGENPTELHFSKAAYELWKNLERSIEPRIGDDGDLRHIKPWASKLPGAVARIAAVCHAAANLGNSASPLVIEEPTVASAILTGKLLIPHALAVYRLMFGGSKQTAASVVRYFNAKGWPTEALPLSAWWRQVRSIVGESSKAMEPIAKTLCDHGYLISVPHSSEIRTGRPGTYYRANRRLFDNKPT